MKELTQALDRREEPLTLFFRDDDAGWDMPALDALLEIWPVFEAFQTGYVAKGLILDAEKNVSAPSPTGPSAGATGTARPARAPAPTAPQD